MEVTLRNIIDVKAEIECNKCGGEKIHPEDILVYKDNIKGYRCRCGGIIRVKKEGPGLATCA